MLRSFASAAVLLVGCAADDCPLHAPSSVCFVAEDGATTDYSDEVAAGTTAEAALLWLDQSGRLVFGPGTFRVQISSVAEALEIEGAGAQQTVLAGTRPEAPTLYGSVVALLGERATLEVSGLTIEDGAAIQGGAILADRPEHSVTVREVTFRDNASTGSTNAGGAIFAAGPLTVDRARFERNTAVGGGGAIYAGGPTATITNTTFEGNEVSFGGGGALWAYTDVLELWTCELVDNAASEGGALVLSAGRARLEGTTLRDNRARSSAGAVMIFGATASFAHVELAGNVAPSAGALHVIDGEVALTTTSLLGNRATDQSFGTGGAVRLLDSALVAKSSDFGGNRAGLAGSAVALEREGAGSSFVSERTRYQSNEGPAVGSPPVMNLQVEGSTFAPDGLVDFRCDVTGCR